MNELRVNTEDMTVSARDLHKAVGTTERFSTWFERQLQYGFEEGIDFVGCKEFNTLARQELQDYRLTADCAKQICMIQRTDAARQVRQYLIDLEKAWNTPEQVMARALRIAEQTIASLKTEAQQMTAQIEELKPKGEYFDELVDRNLLTNFRDTAKELGIREKDFISELMARKYIYRDQSGQLKPYSGKGDGLFKIKEFN